MVSTISCLFMDCCSQYTLHSLNPFLSTRANPMSSRVLYEGEHCQPTTALNTTANPHSPPTLRLRLPFSHPPYKLLPGLAAVHRYSDVVVHRCTCCTDAVLRSRGAVSVQHRGCQCLASV